MSNFYYDVSFNAAEKIKSAMIVLDQCSQNGTCATAINFNLCGPQLNTTDYRNLYTSLLDLYKRIPQYSFPWVELLPVDAILELINLTEAANSTAEVLEAPMQIHNFATTDLSQCTNWTNASFTLGATRAGSWGWITCNYNIVNQWSIGENNIMPAKDDTGRVEICLVPEWAGPMSNWTNEEWIDWNGFSDEQLTKTERLLFIGGQYGPFSAISLPNLPVSSDRNAARSILVDGLGHGGDMAGTYVLPKGVSANLDMVRGVMRQFQHLTNKTDSGYEARVSKEMD